MNGQPTWTDFDEAEDYFVPNVCSPRDLLARPDCALMHARRGTPFAGSACYIYHICGSSPPYEQILCGA